MESLLDDICAETQTYETVMDCYWGRLSTLLKQLETHVAASKPDSGGKKQTQWNELGTQTIGGKSYRISIETTRYGPAVTRCVMKGGKETKEYGNIPKGTDVTQLSLEDAIGLLPLQLGTWKRNKVVAKKGKYGPYLQIGSKRYVSLPKDIEWLTLHETAAKEYIRQDDKETEHAAQLSSAVGMNVLRGPKGWYMRGSRGRSGISIGDSILDQTASDLQSLIQSKDKGKRKDKAETKGD